MSPPVRQNLLSTAEQVASDDGLSCEALERQRLGLLHLRQCAHGRKHLRRQFPIDLDESDCIAAGGIAFFMMLAQSRTAFGQVPKLMPQQDLELALQSFNRLQVSTAQRAVRFYQTRQDAGKEQAAGGAR